MGKIGLELGSYDLEIEISNDGFMDEHSGFLCETTSIGEVIQTSFMFEEDGYVRLYATKGAPADTLLVHPEGTYLVKADSMAVGDSWSTWNEEGYTTVAVVDTATVTTLAGAFFCYKVEADAVERVWWYSDGQGIIKVEMPSVWWHELADFSVVGGSGFLPLAVGNQWRYSHSEIPVRNLTWGEVKAGYRR